MTDRNRKNAAIASSEAAELHGNLFSVVIHDLGAIATALTLRAEALASVLSSTDQSALLSLSSELADIKRSLRIAQGPRGSASSLSPERRMPANEWWRIISRFVSSTLARGVTSELAPSAAFLTPQQANGLTLMWLAACKDASENGLSSPTSIRINISHSENGSGVVFTAARVMGEHALMEKTPKPSKWFRYAKRVARANNATLSWWEADKGESRWQCTIT